MTENKTRRNFLAGSVAVPGSIAAAAALQHNASNAATPQTKTTAVGKGIDPDRLSRFKQEVKEKAVETLDYSPLFKLFSDYGFPERSYKVQVICMLDKIQANDGNKQAKKMTDPELENSLIAMSSSGEEVLIQTCIGCGGSSC